MKTLHKITSLVVFGLALGVGAFLAVSSTRATPQRVAVQPERPAVGGVRRIVAATPFVLDRAWTHAWRKESGHFRAGWLLVLEVDSALVEPRQVEEPVLFAGAQTVERVNHGFESGRVVAILPSDVDAEGHLTTDLATVPFFFGAPALPERVDAAQIERELAHARELGVKPLSLPVIGELLHVPSRDELAPITGQLVLEHSPAEQDLGIGLLTPLVK